MFIVPISGLINPIEKVENTFKQPEAEKIDVNSPTFLDVFTGIVSEAAETQQQKNKDMIDLMTGDVDNIEQIQANITKAEVALDLLVNVKNTVIDSYNEIVKMSI